MVSPALSVERPGPSGRTCDLPRRTTGTSGSTLLPTRSPKGLGRGRVGVRADPRGQPADAGCKGGNPAGPVAAAGRRADFTAVVQASDEDPGNVDKAIPAADVRSGQW